MLSAVLALVLLPVLLPLLLLRLAFDLGFRIAFRAIEEGSRRRVVGFGRQRLASVADAGYGRGWRRETAVDASVIQVDRPRVLGDERIGGEEEDVGAVGRGVD